MCKLFGVNEEVLEKKKSCYTAKEILQQPELWKETLEIFEKSEKSLREYLKKIGFGKEFDVIFTGAGTSEYVGNILEPLLRKDNDVEFKSLATTDILTNPMNYLKEDRKTLLVSFARSGDSPESMAVVKIANKNIKDIYHLFITCNKEGALAKSSIDNENTFMLLMPEKSNDKGFAMTSSFSCMLLSGILAFSKNSKEVIKEMKKIIALAEKELENKYVTIRQIAEQDHKRIVILGSGVLKGLAQELSLKVMELSAGKVVSTSNSTLGFRHGPKAIVNDETIVFELINQNQYAKKYDEGLLEEMYEDKTADKLVAYCIEKSEKYLGNTTDNPFPTGEVNRVVKKFKIHEFN